MPSLPRDPINVAILGSGGREHALAWKIAQSPLCRSVTVLPGNPGMLRSSKMKTAPVNLKDLNSMLAGLRGIREGVELVVIGPDDLLALGLTDFLVTEGFRVFGPTRAAAQLEWSKAFAKDILREAKVPAAESVAITEIAQLSTAIGEMGGFPTVLKFDGMALGKGVQICSDLKEAKEFATEVFSGARFGSSSGSTDRAVLLVEKHVTGREVSLFALTDGVSWASLEPACDYKRLGVGNQGPNTGGMGAYSPVPWLSSGRIQSLGDSIFGPILKAMHQRGTPFSGLLYAGLMIESDRFWVLEFNARFGDPETQVLLPRLETDLLPLLYGVAAGAFPAALEAFPLRWAPEYGVNVVAASRGYPAKLDTGHPLSHGKVASGSEVFFAGVTERDGELVNSGGRVFSVTALGEAFESARTRALTSIEALRFEGMQYRTDIAEEA